MSAYNKAGAVVYYAYKAYEIKQAYEIYQQVKNTPQATDAMLTLATKIAETVGIGIPVWFADKFFTKTGLDRIFDSLIKDTTFEQYLKDQKTASKLREVGIGITAEILLDHLRNRLSESGVLDPLFREIADFFNGSQRARPYHADPLILDLDGDGLETMGVAAGILFDHDGDGLRTGSGWVGADDGFLVLDRNGNGQIDTGFELFGNATPLEAGGLAADGFAALAQEDSNLDGKVDASDARWNDLRVWRDLNQDGISQSGELFTLDRLDIRALNVAATAHRQVLADGNEIADLGTYVRSDGSLGQTADINLGVDTFNRAFTDSIPLTEQARALPDMQGSGLVRDLRQAASQSGALAGILEQYAAANEECGQVRAA